MSSIFIASDIALYRESIAKVLHQESNTTVVHLVASVDSLFSHLSLQQVDIVLLDMAMPGSQAAINTISSQYNECKIICLSVPEKEDEIIFCAEAGIYGYITRQSSVQELLKAVAMAASGEVYCPEFVAQYIFKRVRQQGTVIPIYKNEHHERPKIIQSNVQPVLNRIHLTPREKEIALLLQQGLPNKKIAQKLSIELSTVKNHVHNILSKVGAKNRSHKWQASAE